MRPKWQQEWPQMIKAAKFSVHNVSFYKQKCCPLKPHGSFGWYGFSSFSHSPKTRKARL